MYKIGYARRIYLQKDSDFPAGYLQPGETIFPKEYTSDNGVVFCQIEEEQCPYNQEGERVVDFASDMETGCICKSDGLIKPRLGLVVKKH